MKVIFGVVVVLVALNCVHGSKMKPSKWMSSSQLEQIPSLEKISIEKLENMSVEKGAKMIEHIYHVSQINHNMRPSFVPKASNISSTIYKANGQKINTTLDKVASICKQQPNLGNDEVTIFITGYPAESETVKKASRHMIEAYMQRYNNRRQKSQKSNNTSENMKRTSSEEDASEEQNEEPPAGNIMIIDMGSKMNSMKHFAQLDTEKTGDMMAAAIMEMIRQCDMPDEMIHMIAQGIAAHVAGAAGRAYSRHTGRQMRRITALDPSKNFARDPQTLAGLSRGDAEFVDAIHTNVYGMGTIHRVGDVDFYPNGITAAVPGAKNVIESSMRATHYFAESVRPGNERNFPAVAAESLKDYQNNNGHGKRAFMGINTDYDVKGDYMLEVNEKSPFGKRNPAQKQNSYHGMHRPKVNAKA